MRSNNSVKLDELRRSLPAFDEAAACAAELRAAMFGGVSEQDVTDIMKTFVAKAKAGDAAAAKLVLSVVAQSAPRATLSIGVRGTMADGGTGNGHGQRMLAGSPASAREEAAQELLLTRTACAEFLGRLGPQTTAELAEHLSVPAEEIGRALAQGDLGWFEDVGRGKWRLTSIGRKEALGGGLAWVRV